MRCGRIALLNRFKSAARPYFPVIVPALAWSWRFGPSALSTVLGKVQREVPADNEELARAMCRFRCCCHQNSLYQLHTSRSHGYVSIMSRFGGNTSAPALAMPVLCVAQFVVVLDATIVTTALPSIRQALGFSGAGLQWVFTAYALVFGGLLIFGGRVADVAGRRRTFLIGLGLFTTASGGCALAWSPAALVAARVSKLPAPLCSRLPPWPCSLR